MRSALCRPHGVISHRKRNPTAHGVPLCNEYDPQPPYDAGAPSKVDPLVVEKARVTVKDIVAKALASA